jgi:DNA repair protein RecN (Recombination protein N)
MLTHLNISDFAIIPALELDFDGGFTAITGETGAGKSILVDALGLLLGDRADSQWVRAGASKAELSAEFSLAGNPEAAEWLSESELSEAGACLLRRVIAASGRSRAFINGTPVTLAQLQSLGDLLVELHGQNEHLLLTRRDEQFRLLDEHGGYATELDAVSNAWSEFQQAEHALADLKSEAPASANDLDFLRFQVKELQETALAAGAVEELEINHERLARAGSLLESVEHSVSTLEDDEHGAGSLLHSLIQQLEEWRSLDADIAEAEKMLREAAINCDEALSSLQRARDRINLDPGRLQQLSQQLGSLHDLARKHGVRAEELEQVRDRLTARLKRVQGLDAQRAELETRRDLALAGYRIAARVLSDCRHTRSLSLSARVTGLMAELGMPGGVFELRLEHHESSAPSRRGDNRLELLVSANAGVPPGPIRQIASGGELSRISLAIKLAASNAGATRSQVFDEVDAGIGGETANTVGALLQRLAGDAQVLCVTHLAQVAVCAAAHHQVIKASSGDGTQVSIRALDRKSRVDEIARMLGGRISDQSRAHAEELLKAAGSTRN